MASLYEILNNAYDGEGMAALGREFGLTPEQTQAAVTALLPAISTGLKRSTATPEGLGNLFGVMGQQQNLAVMYADPQTAFGPDGVAAGNDALSVVFGSPNVSQAVIDQAQAFSGVGSGILKKMLPVLAGIVLSGLMRSKTTAATPAPAEAPGGNLGDILGQIFGRQMPGSAGPAPAPAPSAPSGGGLGDILGQIFGRQMPGSTGTTAGPAPSPADSGGYAPQGDILGTLLRELAKGISNGSIKPVIISGGGPIQIPMPGGQQGQAPSGQGAPQVPGGEVFGQILRDILGKMGGAPGQMPQSGGGQGQSPQMKDLSDLSKQLGVMGGPGAVGAGVAVFGDQIEVGRDVDPSHVEKIHTVFDRMSDAPQSC